MTNSRATPATTATPAAAGHTRLPTAWHEQVDWELDNAYTRGVADGRAQVDAELVLALAQALGGTDCDNYRDAVRRHQRALDQRTRRTRFDNGDPETINDWLAFLARHAADMRQRDAAQVREAIHDGPALYTWADVHASVSPAVWSRILADLAPGPRGSRDRAIAETAAGHTRRQHPGRAA